MDEEKYKQALAAAKRSRRNYRILAWVAPPVIIILLITFTNIDMQNHPDKYNEPEKQDPPNILRIESDTEWSGFIDNRTVDGTGNRDLQVQAYGDRCYSLQKTTAEGYLRLSLVDSDGKILVQENETTARYGSVMVCR